MFVRRLSLQASSISSKTQLVLLPRFGALGHDSFALEATGAADVHVEELRHGVLLRDPVAFRRVWGVAEDLLITSTLEWQNRQGSQ